MKMFILSLLVFSNISPGHASYSRPVVRCGVKEVPLCPNNNYSHACSGRTRFMSVCEVVKFSPSLQEGQREMNQMKEDLERFTGAY